MALLKDATRIYGRANVDNQLTVGSLATSNVTRSTSNTTGTIVLVGNAGIATKGNIYSGNIVITGAVNSNGITFADGTRQVTSALEKSNWTANTPTITAATGSFTTVSATGAYQVIGKTCFVTINISITTAGTAAGTIYATLPFTSAARIQIGGYGMEVNSTGNMLKGYIPASSTQLQITTYSNGSTIGDGYSPILTVVYEIA